MFLPQTVPHSCDVSTMAGNRVTERRTMTTTTTELPSNATRPPETNPPALPLHANPRLTAEDCAARCALGAVCRQYKDGEFVYHAGEVDVDLVVVESGQLDMLNPADGDRCIATHGPGEFTGDIDLLTRRPVLVSGRAHGPTGVYRVPGETCARCSSACRRSAKSSSSRSRNAGGCCRRPAWSG